VPGCSTKLAAGAPHGRLTHGNAEPQGGLGHDQDFRGRAEAPGDIFKNHGRIYEVVEGEEGDQIGARYGKFRQTNGEVVDFNVFEDVDYELRSSMSSRKRFVEVAADDLVLVLRRVALQNITAQEEAALKRLRGIVEG